MTPKNTDYKKRQNIYLVKGCVVLAGYVKYHNGACNKLRFVICKQVAVQVWKEQMWTYTKTSFSESV